MGSQDGRVYAWDLKTEQRIAVSPAQPDYVETLAVSTNGWVIFAGFGKEVQLWNPDTGVRWPLSAARPTSNLVLRPDGTSITFGTADGSVEYWDLTTEQRLRSIRRVLGPNDRTTSSLNKDSGAVTCDHQAASGPQPHWIIFGEPAWWQWRSPARPAPFWISLPSLAVYAATLPPTIFPGFEKTQNETVVKTGISHRTEARQSPSIITTLINVVRGTQIHSTAGMVGDDGSLNAINN